MKVIYYIHRTSVGGGVKVLFQHSKLLKSMGFEVDFLTLKDGCPNLFEGEIKVIEVVEPSLFQADLCIATKPGDILSLFSAGIDTKMPIFHFIQGDEIGELEARIRNLLNFQDHRLKVFRNIFKVLKYFRRKKRFERAYRLPTVKMGVSRHICLSTKARFNQDCFEIPNGIDLEIFKPATPISEIEEQKIWKIVSIGPICVKTKGIEYILEAVKLLKEARLPVHLTRIAGAPISKKEKLSGLVDSYYQAIPEREVVKIIQASDVMVLGSLEEEGFGLPSLEAMACKIPCILTRIPAFTSFSNQEDFAYFVTPRNSQAIADGIIKIMTDKECRLTIVDRGFKVVKNYSLDMVGDKLANFLMMMKTNGFSK